MSWAISETVSYKFRDLDYLKDSLGNSDSSAATDYMDDSHSLSNPEQHSHDESSSNNEEGEGEDESVLEYNYMSSLVESILTSAFQKRIIEYNRRSQATTDKPLIIQLKDYTTIGNSALGESFLSELENQIMLRRAEGQKILLVATAHEQNSTSESPIQFTITRKSEDGEVTDDQTAYIALGKENLVSIASGPRLMKQVFPLSKIAYNRDAKIENLKQIRYLNSRYLDIQLQRLLSVPLTKTDSDYPSILSIPNELFSEIESTSSGMKYLSSGLASAMLLFKVVTVIKGIMVKEKLEKVDMDLLDRAISFVRSSKELDRSLAANSELFKLSPDELVSSDIYFSTHDDLDEFPSSEIIKETNITPENSQTDTIETTSPTDSLSKHIESRKRHFSNLSAIQSTLNKREKALFRLFVEPQDIKVDFDSVITPPATIDSLNDTVTLALAMPHEFSYGVLANHHTSGVLLYGPPGTGKTLLVKALAKAGHTSVLEVRPGDVLDKYVGEAEKNVQAIFSLAKKLSPCIIFLDEVDALLANRSNMLSSSSRARDTINQFMAEWDGVRSEKVLLIGATNRPFDLDDAILRRFPRRILVDLPTEKNREDIFRVHLKDEKLDADSITIEKLAKETNFFSGSDIKNVCVSAALQAVKELKQKVDDGEVSAEDAASWTRTLARRHFDHALKQTGSSISDDMSSINMIREWDKEFGQNAKKQPVKGWGFSQAPPIHDLSVRVEP